MSSPLRRSGRLTTHQLRESFLSYFEQNDHKRVPSSSLVPANDPSLLFTNAGMVQFKNAFLGLESPVAPKIVTSQKCVRAGGKHNDLDNVGQTARHHTFFEMLGNFSFGAYGKEDAMHLAWKYLTNVLELPSDRLFVSVLESDDDSVRSWQRVTGFTEQSGKLFRKGPADNYWSMGETGPCGPCTEIFWDQKELVDGERFLEIWNIVFMQECRDAAGKLTRLPKLSIDTGMGLERIASVVQGASSNYGIDAFTTLLTEIKELVISTAERNSFNNSLFTPHSHLSPQQQSSTPLNSAFAMRVIADHLRCVCFLAADGVLPASTGRGYVFRRILRRAVMYGAQLGFKGPFLSQLIPKFISSMSVAYPELGTDLVFRAVKQVVLTEEQMFFSTMLKGLSKLEDAFTAASTSGQSNVLGGQAVFTLDDTFGFPLELSQLIARQRGWSIDLDGYNKLMDLQKQRGRESWKGGKEQGNKDDKSNAATSIVQSWMANLPKQEFVGYKVLSATCTIMGAVQDSETTALLSIHPCPFYSTSGGQVGDRGYVVVGEQRFEVLDTIRPFPDAHILRVKAKAAAMPVLQPGTSLEAHVDPEFRAGCAAHHTATHLLQAALSQVLSRRDITVRQAGSLVGNNRLRFDFTCSSPCKPEELSEIEAMINQQITSSKAIKSATMGKDEAVKRGAVAMFGEKYGDQVRVIEIPDFSMELCGGTHVTNTSHIQALKILSESSIGAGVRRIEAVAGKAAIAHLLSISITAEEAARKLKVGLSNLHSSIDQILAREKKYKADLLALEQKLATGSDGENKNQWSYWDVHKTNVRVHTVSAEDLNAAMKTVFMKRVDQVVKQAPRLVHVFLSLANGHCRVYFSPPSPDASSSAVTILRVLLGEFGGKGGGDARAASGVFQDSLLETECDWKSRIQISLTKTIY